MVGYFSLISVSGQIKSSDSAIILPDSNTSAKSIIIRKEKSLKPGTVALMSTVVPGLGQVYNRQWYKVPFFYALLGGGVYLISTYNHDYLRYKRAYITRTDRNPNTLDEFDPHNPRVDPANQIADSLQLLAIREDKHRYRDLSAILFTVIYAANILDAYVYAQLRDFDVSDNLSLQWTPLNVGYSYNAPVFTTSLKLKLRK